MYNRQSNSSLFRSYRVIEFKIQSEFYYFMQNYYYYFTENIQK